MLKMFENLLFTRVSTVLDYATKRCTDSIAVHHIVCFVMIISIHEQVADKLNKNIKCNTKEKVQLN